MRPTAQFYGWERWGRWQVWPAPVIDDSHAHDPGLAAMNGDPLLERLAADPRHRAFLKKMRLPS